jgi:lipid-A-disaccharide synthase-like uncharacterized protein
MDWLMFDGKFLGIEWHFWKVIGWLGNLVFSTRFVVQWYATEKRKEVTVPPVFWWLSLVGSLLLLSYALFWEKSSVFIFAYAFTWIPYVRNLMIHRKHDAAKKTCAACGHRSLPKANFCSNCGVSLAGPERPTKQQA